MSLLVINVGNSRLVAARTPDGADFAPLLAAATPADAPARDVLAARVASLHRAGEPVAVASVVPATNEALRAVLPDARFVDHTWAFPFAHEIRQPETVGADRWCNVAAAAAAGLDDAIVVDAGTATTFDVLAGGVFRGGLIAPGMAFAARKLQEQAARLWPVEFAACELRPGRDTAEALAIGAYHVGVHGILGTVAALRELQPQAQVVLTGGLAGHLEGPDRRHDPDWTLRGLAALAGV